MEAAHVPHAAHGADTMSPALRTAHNYYDWIAAQFQPVLGRRILDIGGGHGAHLEHVVGPDRFVYSVDVSPECVADMSARFAPFPFDASVGDVTEPVFVARLTAMSFDTILCVNVLEHIERDDLAIRGMASILRPTGGRLFLLVPAHPFLYGSPDRLAGHYRRYARRRLVESLGASGFVVRRAYYFNSFGALPYLVNARLLRPRSLSGAMDTQIILFDRFVIPWLRPLERLIRLPFGQSVIVIAEVPRG